MEVLEADIISEDSTPEIYSVFQQKDADQYVGGRFLRYGVGIIFVAYGIAATILGIKAGFYAIKIFMVVSTGLLLFRPSSYPYLLGLLIPVYYYLKTHQAAVPEFNYTAHFSSVMVILMTGIHWAWKQFNNNRRNPYQRINLCSICLLGLFGIVLLGRIGVANRFLYFDRTIDILAFVCAFYIGRSCLNIQGSLKLLLIGLALGIFAFELPYSVGFVLSRGIGVIGRLDMLRREVGAGTGVGTESGTVLVAFVLAYSLSSSGVSRKIRRIALWGVAIPAAIVIMIFLSRGAIILLPITVLFNLILSGRRRTAILAALVSMGIAALAYIKFPGVFFSFGERMQDIFAVAAQRGNIRLEAIRIGLSHPLLGIGASQYRLFSEVTTAHNEELNILAEHGVISFVLYIMFLAYLGYMVLKLRLSEDYMTRSIGGIFLVLLSVYFAYAQIQPMYFNRGGILFAFCAGMLVTLYYQSQEREIHKNL